MPLGGQTLQAEADKTYSATMTSEVRTALAMQHEKPGPYFHTHIPRGAPFNRQITFSPHAAAVAGRLKVSHEYLYRLVMAYHIGEALRKEFGAKAPLVVDHEMISIWQRNTLGEMGLLPKHTLCCGNYTAPKSEQEPDHECKAAAKLQPTVLADPFPATANPAVKEAATIDDALGLMFE